MALIKCLHIKERGGNKEFIVRLRTFGMFLSLPVSQFPHL